MTLNTEGHVVRVSYTKALMAVMLALLVAGPALTYPASALSTGQEGPSILDLNMELSERIAANMSRDYPEASTISAVVRATEALQEKMSETGLEAEDVTFNLSKVRIPAIILDSIDDDVEQIKYAYKYMLLKNQFNFNEFDMDFTVEWEDGSPVTYNPNSPQDSVFGGLFTHRVTFTVEEGEPIIEVSEGAGDAEQIVEIFMEHTSFNVYLLQYEKLGATMDVDLSKIEGTLPVNIKDYSVYTAVAVQVYYDPEIMDLIDAIRPQDGSYTYFATAKVSFTVTLLDASPVELGNLSTWDLEPVTYDISEPVIQALDTLESLILGNPLIPEPVQDALAGKISQWKGLSYTITTRHSVVSINITWILTDEYDVYENGSYVGGGNQVILADTMPLDFQADRSLEVLAGALEQADSKLAPYYPGGVKAFLYDDAGAPYPVMLYTPSEEGEGSYTPLTLGAPSNEMVISNGSLLLTTYPLKANTLAGEKRITDLEIIAGADATSDYRLSVDSLETTVYYRETFQDGNTTIDIYHTYTLAVYLDAEVEEYAALVRALPYDLQVTVHITPIIVAANLSLGGDSGSGSGGSDTGSGRGKLLPALAPLGGDGVFDLVKGSAEQFDFQSIVDVIGTVQAITGNDFFSWVFPTYIPAPMPHDSIKIFAPGEYIGVYYMAGKFRISFGGDGLLGAILGFLGGGGKPLFSIMYEKVDVKMKSVHARASADDPSVARIELVKQGDQIVINRSGEDGFRLYSLGFGVGEVKGKTIGPRFYLAPSSKEPGDTPLGMLDGFLNNDLMKFLTEGSFITDLLDGIIPGSIFQAAREIYQQMSQNGLYPQITVYFGGEGSIWPYFMISPKSTYRLVANRPGDYVLSADANFNMLHVRVYKVPILGIPIPVPIFVSHHEHVETTLKVRNIKALPLLVNYVVEPPESLNMFQPLRTGERFSGESYIGIYAVPVWVDLDGFTPISPVLFRGQYGSGEDATGLTIVALSPLNTVINASQIYFFGIPLSMVKIPLHLLDKMTRGEESAIILKPAWKHGRTVSTLDNAGVPTVLRVARVKTFPLFQVDGKVIMYTGVYDPGNKIHEFAKSVEKKVNEVAGEIQYYLAQANNTLLMVLAETNNIASLLSLIDQQAGNINEILMQISQELVNQLMQAAGNLITQLITQFVTNAIAAVIGAVVPDPTGFISGYIQDIILNLINEALSNVIPSGSGDVNITELLINYGLQALTFIALKIAYDTIGYQGLMNLIQGVQDIVLKGIDMITRVNNTINYILELVNNTVEMAKYKPMVLSQLQVYNLAGQPVETEGVIARLAGSRGEGLILPLDAVETNIEGGAVLYTAPYSTLTFLLQLITGASTGEYPNVAVSVPDALFFVAAWANFIASILGDDGQGVQEFAGQLIQLGFEVQSKINTVQEWVEIPGIDTHTILLPSTVLVPPSRL